MRIVGGQLRGRRLEAPQDRAIRPTSDRAREALFNILDGGRLGSLPPWPERAVLDVFAGSGAVGLEALSRGASWAGFIESDRAALKLCERNLKTLGLGSRGQVMAGSALSPPRAVRTVDFVFLDPPYDQELLAPSLTALQKAGWLAKDCLVATESAKRSGPPVLPKGFELLEQRHYGKASITFARWRD